MPETGLADNVNKYLSEFYIVGEMKDLPQAQLISFPTWVKIS